MPRLVLPALKVTVPVGVPDPGDKAATTARSVTAWPNTDGVRDVVTAVLVDA